MNSPNMLWGESVDHQNSVHERFLTTSDILTNIFLINAGHFCTRSEMLTINKAEVFLQSPAETSQNDRQNAIKRQTNVKYFIIAWWPATIRKHCHNINHLTSLFRSIRKHDQIVFKRVASYFLQTLCCLVGSPRELYPCMHKSITNLTCMYLSCFSM